VRTFVVVGAHAEMAGWESHFRLGDISLGDSQSVFSISEKRGAPDGADIIQSLTVVERITTCC